MAQAEEIGRLGLPYVGGFNSSFITFGLAIALRELPVGQENLKFLSRSKLNAGRRHFF